MKAEKKYVMLAVSHWQELDEVTHYTPDDYYTCMEPVWKSDVMVITKCQSDDLELMKS